MRLNRLGRIRRRKVGKKIKKDLRNSKEFCNFADSSKELI